MNSPLKGQWRGVSCFLWSASEYTVEKTIVRLRRYRVHYDITVMRGGLGSTIFVWRRAITSLLYLIHITMRWEESIIPSWDFYFKRSLSEAMQPKKSDIYIKINIKMPPYQCMNSIIKIRRSHGCIIFIMIIPYLQKVSLYRNGTQALGQQIRSTRRWVPANLISRCYINAPCC